MKIQKKNNAGFTLIELIMIIVIIGILSAVIVPRFFDFSSEAEESTEDAFIAGLKTGLNLYSTNQLLDTGLRTFPRAGWSLFDRVLDETPDNWSYDSTITYGLITHTRHDGSLMLWRYLTKNGYTEYELQELGSGPPPPPGGGGSGYDPP